MKKDPGRGANADGSKSAMYCSYCYVNGGFKNPDWTARQMQAFCKSKLQEMGFPGFLAGWFTKRVPNLERWKK
jgi:hypothetical protein